MATPVVILNTSANVANPIRRLIKFPLLFKRTNDQRMEGGDHRNDQQIFHNKSHLLLLVCVDRCYKRVRECSFRDDLRSFYSSNFSKLYCFLYYELSLIRAQMYIRETINLFSERVIKISVI